MRVGGDVGIIIKNRIRTTKVFDTYWKFAAERQNIFFRRLSGEQPPWTNDPILSSYKFTNAYRASDRVSQYLIRNVIYSGDYSTRDCVFRILLFKIFNKIETWELLKHRFGDVVYEDFSVERYASVLTAAMKRRQPIYSSAYLMPAAIGVSSSRQKHITHLRLLELMIEDRLPEKIAASSRLQEVYELIYSYPSMGPFLAYQYAIDINYSEVCNFSESEFVVPGPGARDGIRKCFQSTGGLTEPEIIAWVTDSQDDEFSKRGIDFSSLWGRRLQLIDCQNLFCEVDKYSRVMHPEVIGISGRTRIKQKYKLGRTPPQPWYPPKWSLNCKIPTLKQDGAVGATQFHLSV